MSINPLFQVGFTNEPPMRLRLASVEVAPVKLHTGGAQLDLFMTWWKDEQGLRGVLEYNRKLFKKDSAKRQIGHFTTLVDAALVSPEQPVALLDMITDSEHEQLRAWNETDAPLPSLPVHALIEAQVYKSPGAAAVRDNDVALTYKELWEESGRLATALAAAGIREGSLVGIMMDRSARMVPALCAVLRAGGAYVPLDPSFPEQRLQFMVEDTGLKLALVDRGSAAAMRRLGAEIIIVEDILSDPAWQPGGADSLPASPDALAYIIYTSGSTGRPKGVMVPHGAVVNFLLSMGKRPGLSATDILVAVTTLSFDIAVLELFLPLTVGAEVVVADRRTAADGERLKNLLHESRATVMQATPVTWYLLLAAGWEADADFKILCGGETFPEDLADRLCSGGAEVWNLYGPTETTVWSACGKVKAGKQPVAVGRPIDNTRFYIVNEMGQVNPVMITGELLIGGRGMSAGYLGRPKLTRDKFVENVVSEREEKLYRTGDLACLLPDGSLHILGRIDNQVKVRGFRIELGEIEAAIESHPAVERAAVVVEEHGGGDKRLCAYAVTSGSASTAAGDIKTHLLRKLPEYMVPGQVIIIGEMPLTPNGKIDRKALSAARPLRMSGDPTKGSPAGGMEEQLAALWEKILKHGNFSREDNFFDVGGNSLLSLQLLDLIQQETGSRLPMVSLYRYPTISSLARCLKKQVEPKSAEGTNQAKNRAQRQKAALNRLRSARR